MLTAPHSNTPKAGEQTGGEYHAVSGWAVTSLVVGLLSVAAFLGPLVWFVPALGIGLAIFAMRRIRTSGGELTGWNIALLGLLLSLLFGIAGPVRTLSRHYWLQVRAEEFANGFLDLLQQNQPYIAQQFTLHPANRNLAAKNLAGAIAKDEKTQKAFDDYLKREPVKSLLEYGKKAKVELLSSDVLAEDPHDDIGVRYRITVPAAAASRSFNVSLILERSLNARTKTEQWQVLQMAETPD